MPKPMPFSYEISRYCCCNIYDNGIWYISILKEPVALLNNDDK